MRKLLLLIALLCALPAFAQTTTTYVGTIRDLANVPVTSGLVTFALEPGVDTTIAGRSRFVYTVISCHITGTGALTASDDVSPCTVTNNLALTPTGTYYKVSIQPQFVTPGSVLNTFAMGGTVDISTLVPTPATQPNWTAPLIPPNSGGNFTGPITGTSATFTAVTGQTVNGVLSAYNFPGADMCVKIQNAIASLPAAGGSVDAQGFTGTQVCSVNPFANMTAFSTTFKLSLKLGSVHIQTSVPWNAQTTIVMSGIDGPTGSTWVDYTGSTVVPAVFTMGQYGSAANTASIFGALLDGILLTSSSGKATDGLLLRAVHHSEFRNIAVWGVTGCGLHTQWAVTDTFYRYKSSGLDAQQNGYTGVTPQHNICFGSGSPGVTQTTDGTVVDVASEGSTVSGIWLQSAAGMTFTSGTIEGNTGRAMQIDNGSSGNTFIGLDVEGNTGGGILDNGQWNQYYNLITLDPMILGPTSAYTVLAGGNLSGGVTVQGLQPFQIFNSFNGQTINSATINSPVINNANIPNYLRNCGRITSTAALADVLDCSWVTTNSTCSVQTFNGNTVPLTHYSLNAGSVALWHAATAGQVYSVACSTN